MAANHAVNDIATQGYALPFERTHLSDLEVPGRKEEDPEVINYYKQLAEEGDVTAAAALGKMYSTGGRVLDIDYSLAVKYLELAADAGNLPAQGQLSYVLAQGLGGSAASEKYSDAHIFDMARKCAALGEQLGHVALGYIYMHGIGVAVNHTKAFETFSNVHSTAGAKNGDASFFMAEMLMGRGSSTEDNEESSAEKQHAHTLLNGMDMQSAVMQIKSEVGPDGRITHTASGMGEYADDPQVKATTDEIGRIIASVTPEEQKILSRINLMDAQALKNEQMSPAMRARMNKLQVCSECMSVPPSLSRSLHIVTH